MSYGMGVVGCGSHALRNHIVPGKAFGFEVKAVCDPSAENIAKVAAAVGYEPAVCSFWQLLKRKDVNVVLITSPDKHHPWQLLATVLAGKHVLCDKPLAVSYWGLTLVRLAFVVAVLRGVVVQSCHPREEYPDLPYGWVKENLAELTRRFGPLVHIGLDLSYPVPSLDWKKDRSFLLDHYVHEIFVLLWWLDGVTFIAQRLYDAFDRYAVSGITNTDVTFMFMGTRRLEKGLDTFPETIQLRFERGGCCINTKTGQLAFYDHASQAVEPGEVTPMQPEAYDRRAMRVMAGLSRALSSREGTGIADLKLLWKINKSAVALATVGHYHS